MGDSTTSTLVKAKKEVYTLEEVLSDITIGPFTLKVALEGMMKSESEFQVQLDALGFCMAIEFDRNQNFPVEWIRALDTGKLRTERFWNKSDTNRVDTVGVDPRPLTFSIL